MVTIRRRPLMRRQAIRPETKGWVGADFLEFLRSFCGDFFEQTCFPCKAVLEYRYRRLKKNLIELAIQSSSILQLSRQLCWILSAKAPFLQRIPTPQKRIPRKLPQRVDLPLTSQLITMNHPYKITVPDFVGPRWPKFMWKEPPHLSGTTAKSSGSGSP